MRVGERRLFERASKQAEVRVSANVNAVGRRRAHLAQETLAELLLDREDRVVPAAQLARA